MSILDGTGEYFVVMGQFFYSELVSGLFDNSESMSSCLVPKISSCDAAGAGGIGHSRGWIYGV